MKKINQQGQSLFELVVALGVISIVLVSIVSLTTKAVSNSTYSKNNSLAARYNQESLEWIRGQRDLDWTAFFDKVTAYSTYCLSSLSFSSPTGCSPTQYIAGTKFIREASFAFDAGPPAQVTVVSRVSWNDPKGEHHSEATTTLTHWK